MILGRQDAQLNLDNSIQENAEHDVKDDCFLIYKTIILFWASDRHLNLLHHVSVESVHVQMWLYYFYCGFFF